MPVDRALSFSAKLLQECRDMAAKRMGEALPGLMDKVDDALFDLADKGENNQIQSLYFDAMREVRLRRSNIETEFRIQLADQVNARIRRQSEPGGEQPAGTGLLLIENDELEESLAVTNMAGKIRAACKEALYRLDKRMAFLLDEPGLEGEDNPLAPEVICGAFKAACGCLQAELKVKLLILKLFDRFVLLEMEPLYDALNAHLVKRDVLPTLKATVEVRRNRVAVPARGPANAGMPGASAAMAAGAVAPGAVPLASGAGPGAAGWHGTVAGAGAGVTTPGIPAAGAETSSGQVLLDALQSWMHAGAPGVDAPDAGGLEATAGGAAPAGYLIADLTALQHQAVDFVPSAEAAGAAARSASSSGPRFDLRALKGRGIGALLGEGAASAEPRMGHMDEMLIDIVAIMFDYILDDGGLAPPMKALIGRLQIPMLKVAILDKSLFSRRFHPARKLLNALAEAALGWNEKDAEDSLYQQIDSLIHRILDDFDDDVAVFAQALETLESYLREEEARCRRQLRQSARTVQRRERLEAAKTAVKEEIRRVMRDAVGAIPTIVRVFITRYWGGMLVVTHVKEGPGAPAWGEAVRTMEELVWSVTPKPTSEQRQQLLEALPALLKRVNEGIRRISMPPDERDRLVAALARCHADIVRAGEHSGAPGRDEGSDEGSAESAESTEPPAPELPGPQPDCARGEAPPDAQARTGENPAVAALYGPLAYPESELLVKAVARANREIYEASHRDPSLSGMATTVVAALFRDSAVHYIHVGDSRLYRLRHERLEQITKDHSLAQELVDKGFYTEAEANEQVSKNLVTRGLGVDAGIDPDVARTEAEPGDLYLLCSDGLSDMVDHRQLRATLRRYEDDPETLVRVLVKAANDHGGKDNISVLVARVIKPFAARKRWYVAKSLKGKVAFAGKTDVGRKREHNEDSIAIDPELGLAVLADGMGGQNAGEVASAMAVRDIMADLASGIPALGQGAAPAREQDDSTALDSRTGAGSDAEARPGSDGTRTAAITGPGPEDIVTSKVPEPSENPNDIDLFAIETVSAGAEQGGDGPRRAQQAGDCDPAMERMLSLLDRVEVDIESITLDGGAPEADCESADSPGGSGADAGDDPDILAFASDASAVDAAAHAPDPGAAGSDEYDAAAGAVAVGAWVELEDERGKRYRARLSWINQATGAYLFTDRKGLKVAERTRHGFAVELRRGSARVLDSVPIYDRAVTSVLDHLRRRAESDPDSLLADGTGS